LIYRKTLEQKEPPREKKILELNAQWVQKEDSKKKLTGWQQHDEYAKKATVIKHSFTSEKATKSNECTKIDYIKKYKLSSSQAEIYKWLKEQNINTDDPTLCYWSKTYTEKRLKEVVTYAKARSQKEEIRNLGGWIQVILKTNQAVIDDKWNINQSWLKEFLNLNQWDTLKVYEKYIKDSTTGDDLSLTISPYAKIAAFGLSQSPNVIELKIIVNKNTSLDISKNTFTNYATARVFIGNRFL
jgi:hypothetical protein